MPHKVSTYIPKTILLGLFLSLNGVAFSQENLIINPSFEELNQPAFLISDWQNQNFGPYPLVIGWESVVRTCEYFQNNETPFSNDPPVGYAVLSNNSSLNTPFGETFAGMILYQSSVYPWSALNNQGDYDVIRGRFSSPLVAGKKYFFRCFVNRYTAHCGVKEISLTLANDLYSEENINLFQPNPNYPDFNNYLISNTTTKIQIESSQLGTDLWQPVTTSFIANGGERYFYLHTQNILLTDWSNVDLLQLPSILDTTTNTPLEDYTLFDNFSLYEKPYFPTIITAGNDTLNNSFHYSNTEVSCNVSIYDRWGSLVATITPENPYYYSDSPGTYFYTGTCDSWEEKGYFEIVKD